MAPFFAAIDNEILNTVWGYDFCPIRAAEAAQRSAILV
jgi:hypothetical protein